MSSGLLGQATASVSDDSDGEELGSANRRVWRHSPQSDERGQREPSSRTDSGYCRASDPLSGEDRRSCGSDHPVMFFMDESAENEASGCERDVAGSSYGQTVDIAEPSEEDADDEIFSDTGIPSTSSFIKEGLFPATSPVFISPVPRRLPGAGFQYQPHSWHSSVPLSSSFQLHNHSKASMQTLSVEIRVSTPPNNKRATSERDAVQERSTASDGSPYKPLPDLLQNSPVTLRRHRAYSESSVNSTVVIRELGCELRRISDAFEEEILERTLRLVSTVPEETSVAETPKERILNKKRSPSFIRHLRDFLTGNQAPSNSPRE